MNKDLRISYKAARVNIGLTQEQASKKLGISASALFNYENKKTVPSWDVHERMSKLYGIPVENLRG